MMSVTLATVPHYVSYTRYELRFALPSQCFVVVENISKVFLFGVNDLDSSGNKWKWTFFSNKFTENPTLRSVVSDVSG